MLDHSPDQHLHRANNNKKPSAAQSAVHPICGEWSALGTLKQATLDSLPFERLAISGLATRLLTTGSCKGVQPQLIPLSLSFPSRALLIIPPRGKFGPRLPRVHLSLPALLPAPHRAAPHRTPCKSASERAWFAQTPCAVGAKHFKASVRCTAIYKNVDHSHHSSISFPPVILTSTTVLRYFVSPTVRRSPESFASTEHIALRLHLINPPTRRRNAIHIPPRSGPPHGRFCSLLATYALSTARPKRRHIIGSSDHWRDRRRHPIPA